MRRDRWVHAAAMTAAIAAVVVMVAAAGIAPRRTWVPASDWALIHSAVRDVGTDRTPLVGFYSRFGWFHPGPWPVYLLAGGYRLFGSDARALLVAAAALNAVVVAVGLRAAWRVGGDRLLLLAATLWLALAASAGLSVLADPWNPWLAVPAVATTALCCWAVALGHRWYLPVVAAAASYAVQCHIGTALPVAALVGTAMVLAVRSHRRPGVGPESPARAGFLDASGRWRRPVAAAVAVLTVAWMPVLIQQVTVDGEGNLSTLARFFVIERPEASAGLVQGARILATETTGRPPWLGADEPVSFDDPSASDALAAPWVAVLPLLVLACVLAVARRRGDAVVSAGGILALALYVGTGLAFAALAGPQHFWLLRGGWIAGWFIALVACLALVDVAAEQLATRGGARVAPSKRVAAWGVGALAVALSVNAVRGGVGASFPMEQRSEIVAAVLPETAAWLRERTPGADLVALTGTVNEVQGVAQGLYDQLDLAGYDVTIREPWEHQLPPERRSDEPAVLFVVVDETELDGWRRGGLIEVASFEPSEAERSIGVTAVSVFTQPPAGE